MKASSGFHGIPKSNFSCSSSPSKGIRLGLTLGPAAVGLVDLGERSHETGTGHSPRPPFPSIFLLLWRPLPRTYWACARTCHCHVIGCLDQQALLSTLTPKSKQSSGRLLGGGLWHGDSTHLAKAANEAGSLQQTLTHDLKLCIRTGKAAFHRISTTQAQQRTLL